MNALLHQIVADYFERVDSDELGFLTITGVEVDSDLNVAQIFVSVLGDEPSEEGDEAILDALAEHRRPVQRAFAQQAQLRKTPEALFLFDPGVRAGALVEQILSRIDPPPVETTPETSDSDDSADGLLEGDDAESSAEGEQ